MNKKNSKKIDKRAIKELPGKKPPVLSAENDITSQKKSKLKKEKKKTTDDKKTQRKKRATRQRPIPEKLPEKLVRIRKHFNKSQSEMIVIINPGEENPHIMRARISQFEMGTRLPTLIEGYNYAKFAGVTVETLLNDDLDLPFD